MSVALLKPIIKGELYLVSIISTFFFNLGILWIDTQNLELTFSARDFVALWRYKLISDWKGRMKREKVRELKFLTHIFNKS